MAERNSMRQIREVLRLKHEEGRHERSIANAVRISPSTVNDYLHRAKAAGLTWEAAKELSDADVEAQLFRHIGRNEPAVRAPIDFTWVHMELRRVGVTRMLLWTEYVEGVAKGSSGFRPYQYSQFCELYEEYRAKIQPSMRQVHHAGEKAFLDYSGKKPHILDRTTGEVTEVELFVMVLGASNYTYAEATLTQTLQDFVGSTTRGLDYFGAVPEMLVPDQLRSAVSVPHRYEPEINATYMEMAQHYTTAIVPARPRKPKDKAKVEGGVLIAQRWILACLRNRRFFSLEELNTAIGELLEKLNTRPFQKLEGCRRSAFEKFDRPAMKPLPSRRYEIGVWKLKVGVQIDHHIAYDHRHYSVPCELIGAKVDVRATAKVVEVWHNNTRVTSHERSAGPKGTAVTRPEHRPRAHREWGDWPPERLVGWAQTKGPKTGEVAAAILGRGPHPESGRRACLGLFRLGEKYGSARLEAACERALAIRNPTYKSVEAILKTGFDRIALAAEPEAKVVVHENIRGGDYFDRGETGTGKIGTTIEALYLEEERLSIKNDSRVEKVEERPNMSGLAGMSLAEPALEITASSRARETLPALLERLQRMWTMPMPSTRGKAVFEGDRPTSHQEERSSCTSTSTCLVSTDNVDKSEEREESNQREQRERMRDAMMCAREFDSNGPASSRSVTERCDDGRRDD